MLSGVENNTQSQDSSADSIVLRPEQQQELDTQENDFSSSEFTQQSISAQFKLNSFSSKLRNGVLLVKRNELDTARDCGATGLRRIDMSASSLDNRYDGRDVKMDRDSEKQQLFKLSSKRFIRYQDLIYSSVG